jgi:hypothetical protein
MMQGHSACGTGDGSARLAMCAAAVNGRGELILPPDCHVSG